MNKIPVNTTVDISVEDIAANMSPEELGDLFSVIGGAMAVRQYTSNQRRVVIGKIADGLHEDALKMLGEVVALAYHRAKNATIEPSH